MLHEPQQQDDAHQPPSATTEDNYKHNYCLWKQIEHGLVQNTAAREMKNMQNPLLQEIPLNLWA